MGKTSIKVLVSLLGYLGDIESYWMNVDFFHNLFLFSCAMLRQSQCFQFSSMNLQWFTRYHLRIESQFFGWPSSYSETWDIKHGSIRARHAFGYLQCVCSKALHRFLCAWCSHISPVIASFLTIDLMRMCEFFTVRTSDPNVCTACTYANYDHTTHSQTPILCLRTAW